MSFSLIANTAGRAAALVQATDSSNVATDASKIRNIVGGPRHLSWQQTGTAARRLVYVNKTNKLSADTFVMVRADRHVGHSFTLSSWSSYPSTKVDHVTSSNWAPTLVGRNSTDFIQTGLSISATEAVGVLLDSGTAGAYTKTVGQLYFGTAIALPEPLNSTIEETARSESFHRAVYTVREERSLIFRLISRATLAALEALPVGEPVFLYDSLGKVLAANLYHCVITALNAQATGDDTFDVLMEVAQLEHYV